MRRSNRPHDFCFWIADVARCLTDVRFRGQSGHHLNGRRRLLVIQSGHRLGQATQCSQSRFRPTIQLKFGGRTMAVELYHFWSSVCSVRCRMALEEKGVPWTSCYIDLFKFDQMRPEYLAINPRGMVPTLVHDGKPVRESSVINEYIDAAFAGPALTPLDPLGAARMREFIFLCDEGFSAIAKLTLVKYILPKLRNRWSDDELRKQAERRPTKFYQDFHGRAVRGEITEQELVTARATIDELLDHLERMLAPGAVD